MSLVNIFDPMCNFRNISTFQNFYSCLFSTITAPSVTKIIFLVDESYAEFSKQSESAIKNGDCYLKMKVTPGARVGGAKSRWVLFNTLHRDK